LPEKKKPIRFNVKPTSNFDEKNRQHENCREGVDGQRRENKADVGDTKRLFQQAVNKIK
jgi:hypothetical protein